MDLKKLKMLYKFSLASYLFAGIIVIILLSILAIVDDSDSVPKLVSVILASAFWLCLLIGTMLIIIAGSKERRIYRKLKKDNKQDRYKRSKVIGVICFFTTKKSMIIDVLFIISVIITLSMYLMNINIPWLIVTLTTLVIASFIFHSFWNGRVYNCINYLKNESSSKE